MGHFINTGALAKCSFDFLSFSFPLSFFLSLSLHVCEACDCLCVCVRLWWSIHTCWGPRSLSVLFSSWFMILLSPACLVNQNCGVFHFMTVRNVIKAINHQKTLWHLQKNPPKSPNLFRRFLWKLRCLFTSEVIFFSSRYHFLLCVFLLQLLPHWITWSSKPHAWSGRSQIAVPSVNAVFHTGPESDHIFRNPPKTGSRVSDFRPDLGPWVRAGTPDRIECSVFSQTLN